MGDVAKGQPSSLRDIVDEGMSSFQTLLSYVLLPLALPFVFVQEVISWVIELLGLNKRQLEGKVVLITGASSDNIQSYNKLCKALSVCLFATNL